MLENIMRFLKKIAKREEIALNSKDTAKERLHLVLMQDRANVSADFLDLMKQEIIDVIKKYIEVDESAIDVRLTNKENGDGTNGAPALYANIPIVNIKEDAKKKVNKIENKVKKEETNDKKDSSKEKDTSKKEVAQEEQKKNAQKEKKKEEKDKTKKKEEN